MNNTFPTFKQADRAWLDGSGGALEKFIVCYTPASKEEEKEFREQLQAVLDEAVKKRKAKK